MESPLQQSVLELELCSMTTADNGYYTVEATATLTDQHCTGDKPSADGTQGLPLSVSRLEQLDTPCFLVRLPIAARNCSRMAERAAAAGVSLRPHVKTLVFDCLLSFVTLCCRGACVDTCRDMLDWPSN